MKETIRLFYEDWTLYATKKIAKLLLYQLIVLSNYHLIGDSHKLAFMFLNICKNISLLFWPKAHLDSCLVCEDKTSKKLSIWHILAVIIYLRWLDFVVRSLVVYLFFYCKSCTISYSRGHAWVFLDSFIFLI